MIFVAIFLPPLTLLWRALLFGISLILSIIWIYTFPRFINITSPIINVPLTLFFVGTFIGVAPPSFVYISAGKLCDPPYCQSPGSSYYQRNSVLKYVWRVRMVVCSLVSIIEWVIAQTESHSYLIINNHYQPKSNRMKIVLRIILKIVVTSQVKLFTRWRRRLLFSRGIKSVYSPSSLFSHSYQSCSKTG